MMYNDKKMNDCLKMHECLKCHFTKNFSEFLKKSSTKLGIRNFCKACVKI